MTTTTVSNSTALNAALKAAHAGDTILLASGTYSGVVASGLNFASDVTIASANPGAMATLTDLSVQASSGLQFRNLDFFVRPTGVDNPFLVKGSHDIGFSDLSVHGSLDGNPQNDNAAMLVRDSDSITVAHSDFRDLWMGLSHLNTTHFTIEDNTFTRLQVDGIRGGGSSYMTIRDNQFSDFRPVVGDHPDMIQFWTTGATSSPHDIVITGNILQRAGTTAMIPQGIFLGDEANVGYQHVTIEGNRVVGMSYNSIAVYGGSDIGIRDNAIVGLGDLKPRILLQEVNGADISNNQSTYVIVTQSTAVVQTGNTAVAVATDGGAAFTAAWMAAHGYSDDDTAPAAPPTAPTEPAIPTVSGTAGSDALLGTTASEVVSGLAGNDTLGGGAGNDTLRGDDGADDLDGGAGADRLEGGLGSDDYWVDNAGDLVIEATSGATGGSSDKVISSVSFTLGANVERLTLSGAAAVNGTGNAEDNIVYGNSGANQLLGLGGGDLISAGAGNDTLNGGAGADNLAGGAGYDRFIFAKGQIAGDKITDFATGDHIELTGFSAGSTITLMAGSSTTWIVKDAATGATETFQLLNGHKLAAADWLFS